MLKNATILQFEGTWTRSAQSGTTTTCMAASPWPGDDRIGPKPSVGQERTTSADWLGRPADWFTDWIVGTPASQSLSRALSLSENYELLQEFVPEYNQLRQPATVEQTTITPEMTAAGEIVHSSGSLRMELIATFTFTTHPKAPFGLSMLGGMAEAVIDCSNTTVLNRGEAPGGCMIAVADKSVAHSINASGPVLPIGAETVTMHIIVDHEVVETIVNYCTAMVTYHTAIPSANHTAVTLVGAHPSNGTTGTVKSWSLDAANNAAAQPRVRTKQLLLSSIRQSV